MSQGLGAGVRGRLSVIIPVYNYAHFLRACVESVRAQSVDDVEVLVVDDGSTDDSAAVAASLPGVRYIHQANQGLSAARNTGIAACSGEYLLFLDADDQLAPGTLAARLAFARAEIGPGVSVCRTRQFLRTNEAGEALPAAPWWLAPRDLDLRLWHFNIAPPHAWLLHRAVVDAVGGFDTELRACEDYDYWLRALCLGHAPRYSPAGLVYYRKHAASMSADNRQQQHHDVLLHERVFAALASCPQAQGEDPACALLAAVSGAFTTLSRIAGDDYQRLLSLLAMQADDDTSLASSIAPRRVLRDYYLLKLLDAGALLRGRDARVVPLFDALLARLRRQGITVQDTRVARRVAMLADIVRDGGAPLVDRYRVARLALKL
ncbi:MAG: glycosyltransferase [Proteobacteria bacterium]|nr:glycosyltransferase [Pseudomonadota bacterium]